MRQQDLEDSGASSSLSVPKTAATKAPEESYTSDDFEDVSMSGSGAKKFDFASGKKNDSKKATPKMDESDTSGLSMSNSKSANELKSLSRVGESSDVYDEDFEAISQSH